MKKNYFLLVLTILFSGITFAQEAQKNFINYQGVARNASNELIVSEAVTIGIALKSGSANGAAKYEEIHSIATDANGVFSLQIGNGSSSSGDYNSLSWGNEATFITVTMNGSKIGTTEMMSVPYAISSGKAVDQSAAEVLYDNATSGLSATTTQEAIDELISAGIIDADADPANEIQTLSFDAGTNELSLSDGNSVTIPSGGTDADADPTNEIQTISFDAASNKISLTDGGEITIPSGGTDADADPTNEIQTISFDVGTNELSLSDGGSVTIPSGGTDADADPANEFQTLNFDAATNELSLTDGNTVTIPSGGTDADADPTNEIQTISFDVGTNELSLSDGGSVTLSSGGSDADADPENEIDVTRRHGILIGDDGIVDGLVGTDDGQVAKWNAALGNWVAGVDETSSGGGSSLWTENAGDIYFDTGNVGIGLEEPNAMHQLHSATPKSFTHFTTDATGKFLTDGLSIGVVDDFNSEIMNHEKSLLNIGSYGNTIMTVHYNGGVGIGNDEPESLLDVDGAIRSRDLVGGGNVMADIRGNLIISPGDGSSLWSENGGAINYTAGNVGIGTVAPTAKTHVIHDSNLNSPQLRLEESAVDYARLEFKSAATGYWHIAGRGGDTGDVSRLNFYHHNGTVGRDFMTIAGSGNVGIGTALPTEKLDVTGSIRSSDLSGSAQRNVMADADGKLVIGSGGVGSSLWSENGSDIYNNSGNVGIGNTNPGVEPGAAKYLTVATGTSPSDNAFASLEIQGGQGSANQPIGRLDFVSNSAPGNSAIGRIESRVSGGAQFRGDLAFFTKNGDTYATSSLEERMTIKYNGNVGVGTSNPSAKLDVVGDIETSGEIHGPTTGNANMIPIAYGQINNSGAIDSGSGNFSVEHTATGTYEIRIPDSGSSLDWVVSATIHGSFPGHISVISSPIYLRVTTYNLPGDLVNNRFSFVIYTP